MPTIFLSHAATDAEIANEFKRTTEQSFLGLCNIFVSSNLDSINAGAEWHGVIKQNLTESVMLIGLVSPSALQRGWVYAEFGAGWIRNIPVIPLCHSGLERGQLPAPLSSFQALNLNDNLHLSHLYDQIAGALNCQRPNANFIELRDGYNQITEVKRIGNLLKGWTNQLYQWNPNLRAFIESDATGNVSIHIPAQFDLPFQEYMDVCRAKGFLNIARNGFGIGTPVGPQASILELSKGPEIEEFRRVLAA